MFKISSGCFQTFVPTYNRNFDLHLYASIFVHYALAHARGIDSSPITEKTDTAAIFAPLFHVKCCSLCSMMAKPVSPHRPWLQVLEVINLSQDENPNCLNYGLIAPLFWGCKCTVRKPECILQRNRQPLRANRWTSVLHFVQSLSRHSAGGGFPPYFSPRCVVVIFNETLWPLIVSFLDP